MKLRIATCKELPEADADAEPLAAALAALSHPHDAPHARGFLGHADWRVRAAAARALRRIGSSEDFARLCAALGDPNWWVRYRAAQAVCELRGLDATELRALPDRLTDAFAADMLRQALAERDAA